MRVSIIGAGIISEEHLKACVQLDKLNAVSVADVNLKKACDMASKYNLRSYMDYKEMIVKESPDAVIVALPHKLHEEAGIFCMDHGCHVLMEKPMAVNSTACDNLIKASERNNRTLMIGHILYYNEADRMITRIIEEGNLGKITMINSKRYENYFYEGRPSWFLNPEMSGGGIMANVGTHLVERLIRFGGNIKEVKAYAQKRYDCPVEGCINAIFNVDCNITATITVNGYYSSFINELEIVCEKGIIKSCLGKPYIETETENGFETINLTDSSNLFTLQLVDFYECIITGRPPFLSGEYGRKVIEAVERIYHSAGIIY